MATVRRSPEARADLKSIWRYVARKASERTADRLLDHITAAAAILADHPHSGTPRPELQPGIRSRPVGNYVLFYRPVPGGVELVRVLHGRQDVTAQSEL